MPFRCFPKLPGSNGYNNAHVALENEPQLPKKFVAQPSRTLGEPNLHSKQESAPGNALASLNVASIDRTKTATSENAKPDLNTQKETRQRQPIKQQTNNDVELALVARARFESACQLLHKQILEKEHRLTVSELSFLHRLLNDNDTDASDVSSVDPMSDRLSEIESSLHQLKEDPLFTTPPSSPDKSMPISQRTISEKQSRSQSPTGDDNNSRIEVMSADSSHFSVDGALKSASLNRSREEDIFFNNCGSFEQTLYASHSYDDGEEYADHLPSPLHSVQGLDVPDRARATETFAPHLLGNIPVDRVLSEKLMDALRGFLPDDLATRNYWLKFDSTQDESSMVSLLTKIRASQSTILAIKATDGTVFGSFTNTPWRLQKGWFGAGEAFLFRSYDDKIEVYPYTGSDTHVQYCSAQILAVGGGAWLHPGDSPYKQQSSGIGLLLDGDVRGGESNSCATFCNPKLFGRDGDCVGNEFFIDRMEVWTLTSRQTVEAAETSELKELFLERRLHKPLS
ncbi:hypothetical protein MHU86_21006 [Fragilaria crotonensis]|nr:hypothetical protein MHU86_21006 [Fragilaria crotonensis]